MGEFRSKSGATAEGLKWASCILLIFAAVVSLTFISAPIHATGIISHPGGTIIEVTRGQVFLLRYRLEWQEQGSLGYYLINIIWEDNNHADENFTIAYTMAYFDNDGDNVPDPGVDPIENTINLSQEPGIDGTRWTFRVSNATGDPRDGKFNVDICVRAASCGVCHIPTDNHPINAPNWGGEIDIAESIIETELPAVTTIRVLPFFKLENLYKVSLDVNLWLENGSRLVVKFYRYDNAYQAENLFWEGTAPAQVVKAENVPHPRSAEGYPWGTVQKATLVATDEFGNEIQIVENFTVHRSHLWNRLIGIRAEWVYAPPSERDALWRELIGIRAQWPYAP